MKTKCRQCGLEFNRKAKTQMFCNVDCRSKYHSEYMSNKVRHCNICNQEFVRSSGYGYFCSQECRKTFRLDYNKMMDRFRKKQADADFESVQVNTKSPELNKYQYRLRVYDTFMKMLKDALNDGKIDYVTYSESIGNYNI